jgi:TRAP-type C4-dicarboxylate transport system substrate-binding protein
VYTSLQTGVIDGYEHDASTTVQQRFYEVARYMARTRHIAGVLGLFASSAGMARIPPAVRGLLEQAAHDAATYQRTRGPQEDTSAVARLTAQGMMIRDLDRGAFRAAAERLWETEGRALAVVPWLEAIRG